jgi:2'-5' RNA ligase
MRLFTALDLSQEVLLRLERLTSALRPEAQISWSPLDNLHITTMFIGEWPEARLDDLNRALNGLTVRQPFEVEVKDLGWFPNERAPRVFWIGVQAGGHLIQLAKDTEERLRSLGIKTEDRTYSPHLTLARIKGPVPLTRLREIVREMQPAWAGKFMANRFCLFRSDPGSNASIYRKLHEFPFQSAASATS